ncbi:MAG: efflux RND transporter periplasmic adaptor subunit [Candidatus Eisenbacteria sp.]|nr:efflux RND transporter periplasmic adaptor subunit [Candidatus Eisenbacteria bacterium]
MLNPSQTAGQPVGYCVVLSRIRPPAGKLLRGLLTIAFAILVSGCGGGTGDGGASDSTGAGADSAAADSSGGAKLKKKEKAIKVNVAEVRRGGLVMAIHADGAIRTPRSVEVRTKVAGELLDVFVRDGDRVTAGQLLAQIDQREYALSLEESRYRHFQALSQIAAEDDEFTVNHEALSEFAGQQKQLESQYRRGELSREEFQARMLEAELAALEDGAFRQQVFEKRTGMAEARVAEERAKLNLENTEIRAPFAGVVQGMNVVQGEIITLGSRICSIYNNDRLEATVNVLEADLGNLERGRPVLLAVPATGDTLREKVDVISPHLDEASRTCEVIVRFDNPEGRLRPGMFVQAEIAGWIYPDRLQVPKAAVLTRDSRPLVFKVVEDRAQWLYVDIGLENEDWVEILKVHSGGSLAAGERVVVSDHLTLAHEAKIKIRRTLPPQDRWNLFTDDAGRTP